MANSANQFTAQTYRQPYRPAELRGTKGAGNDAYDEFFQALARKFTNSAAEAEAAVKEMRSDMQQCAEKKGRRPTTEERIIAQIALRRLLRFLQG